MKSPFKNQKNNGINYGKKKDKNSQTQMNVRFFLYGLAVSYLWVVTNVSMNLKPSNLGANLSLSDGVVLIAFFLPDDEGKPCIVINILSKNP